MPCSIRDRRREGSQCKGLLEGFSLDGSLSLGHNDRAGESARQGGRLWSSERVTLGAGLDLDLDLTLKGTCSRVPMESISQRALRDATCPNRFPPPAAAPAREIATGAFQGKRISGKRMNRQVLGGKRIWGKGMYGVKIQAGMPEFMPVRLPPPPQKSSTTKLPCPKFACPKFACPILPAPLSLAPNSL